MTLPASISQLGQLVYLQSVQNVNMHIYALITDGSTPNLNTITIEVNADESTAVILLVDDLIQWTPQFALSTCNSDAKSGSKAQQLYPRTSTAETSGNTG